MIYPKNFLEGHSIMKILNYYYSMYKNDKIVNVQIH